MATDLEDRVRARLRQIRFQRGLSLSKLARGSGLAASTISRLEAGARRLTLAHVERLARAMDVPTDTLLLSERGRGADDDLLRSHDGKTWQAVGPERSTGARVYRVGIPLDLRDPVLHGHEGHVWLYVLDGCVRLIVDHHELVLTAGQAAEFQAWRPHWLGAVDRPAEALVIFAPEGQPLRPISPSTREQPRRPA